MQEDKAVNQYLNEVITHNKRLHFPGISYKKEKKEIELREIFVMPWVRDISLDSTTGKKEVGADAVPFDQILRESKNQRLVILGKPGSGKTALLKYIMIEAARGCLQDPDDQHQLLPVFIHFSHLAIILEKSKIKDDFLVDYLYDLVGKSFNLTLSRGFLENYLEKGRVLLMFDGLEEILNEKKRNRIIDMINNLFVRYSQKNTFIITSRIAGYPVPSFSASEFHHFVLEDFGDFQIKEFCQKRTRILFMDKEEAENRAKILLTVIVQNSSLRVLAKNPLLLTIISMTFFHEATISLDLLKLYDKVVKIFFYTWRNQKGIVDEKFKLEDTQHFLEKLGFHMQARESFILDQKEIYKVLTPDFRRVYSLDARQAKALIDKYVKLKQLSTGILEEVTPGQYRFANKSFQEYFTARWIANQTLVNQDLQVMLDYVDRHVGDASWHEVLILALRALPQKQASQVLKHIFKSCRKPALYLKSIAIEDVKCFKGKHFLNLSREHDQPAAWTVILGNNGTGKTTLLECIAALDPIRLEKDTQVVNLDTTRQEFEIAVQKQEDSDKRQITGKVYYHLENTTPATGFIIEHIDILTGGYFNINELTGLYAPVIYAYGASRKSGEAALTGTGNGDRHENLFENKDLMNAEEWLVQADYAARKDPGSTAGANLEKIKKILLDILPDVNGFQFKTESNLRNYVEFHTDYGPVRFKDLSLGYQVMIAWIVDLARQMVERFPDSSTPLGEPVIVLVDEIDLHLHPSWQRDIIHFLGRHFKKAQFIVTAHSPLIVQSVENINVVILQKEDDKKSAGIVNEINVTYNGWTLEEILNDLMGLEKTVSDKYLDLTGQFEKAIYNEDAGAAKKIYNKLDKILHPQNHMRKLMRIQMAALGGDRTE
jgi:predicted ATP-binding protein involved in virulence